MPPARSDAGRPAPNCHTGWSIDRRASRIGQALPALAAIRHHALRSCAAVTRPWRRRQAIAVCRGYVLQPDPRVRLHRLRLVPSGDRGCAHAGARPARRGLRRAQSRSRYAVVSVGSAAGPRPDGGRRPTPVSRATTSPLSGSSTTRTPGMDRVIAPVRSVLALLTTMISSGGRV
jgi:hypothetical protein